MADWYWKRDGLKRGPVDTAQLKQLAQTGQLQPTDTIWREGLLNWVSASNLKGIEFGSTQEQLPYAIMDDLSELLAQCNQTSIAAPPPVSSNQRIPKPKSADSKPTRSGLDFWMILWYLVLGAGFAALIALGIGLNISAGDIYNGIMGLIGALVGIGIVVALLTPWLYNVRNDDEDK